MAVILPQFVAFSSRDRQKSYKSCHPIACLKKHWSIDAAIDDCSWQLLLIKIPFASLVDCYSVFTQNT
ncbi:MAG: hypothetical protein LH647_21775 [Leptolyngbyaceae cyanobacterium CAN_BIN12]|nr:hypothetical protein [Leptolyngbyaceae cyanobacterium CAN_BIN12]